MTNNMYLVPNFLVAVAASATGTSNLGWNFVICIDRIISNGIPVKIASFKSAICNDLIHLKTSGIIFILNYSGLK